MGSANTADEGQSFWRTFEPLWIAALGAQFLVLGNLLLPRLIRMIGRGGAVETVEWAIYMSALFVFPVAVWLTGWVPIDPILSLVICVLIVWSAWQLLREGVLVMMEGVPKHLNLTEVGNTMAGVAGVHSIHDLHIWTLSSGSVALSAHLVLRDLRHWETVLRNMQALLRDRFQINHVTLQPECPTFVVHPPKIPRNLTAD